MTTQACLGRTFSDEGNLRISAAILGLFFAISYLPIASAEDFSPQSTDPTTTQTLRDLSSQANNPENLPENPATQPDDTVTQTLQNLPSEPDGSATQALKSLSPELNDATTQATPRKMPQ